MSWLASHAINPKLAHALGVRGIKGGEIKFPYQRPDGTAFERTRLPDGKTLQPKDEPLVLWWPAGGRASKYVLLCEGEGDTLAAASMLCDDQGEPRGDLPDLLLGVCPVGIPGTGMNTERIAEQLQAAGSAVVYLALDADKAGRDATEKLIVALTAHGIQAVPVELPDGKDLADCLRFHVDGVLPDSRAQWLAERILNAEQTAAERRKQSVQEDIRAKLAKPPPRRAPTDEHDDLKDIETKVWFEVLTGDAVPPGGQVSCPFPGHEDSTPSMKVYDGTKGVWCFACQKGGDIYETGGELWGTDFLETKRRLVEYFPNTRTAERAAA